MVERELIEGKVRITVTDSWDIPGLEQKIKQARLATGTSMTVLCGAAKITSAYWYRIEAGQINSLPVETLRRIEAALGYAFD
jgi:transcriptional regulator with XRE-family HTH domain